MDGWRRRHRGARRRRCTLSGQESPVAHMSAGGFGEGCSDGAIIMTCLVAEASCKS